MKNLQALSLVVNCFQNVPFNLGTIRKWEIEIKRFVDNNIIWLYLIFDDCGSVRIFYTLFILANYLGRIAYHFGNRFTQPWCEFRLKIILGVIVCWLIGCWIDWHIYLQICFLFFELLTFAYIPTNLFFILWIVNFCSTE